MSGAARAAGALALVIALGGLAHAFPTGDQFDADPLTEDGGGGLAFAGGPGSSGHACGVCHTGAPGRVRLRLEADRPELFTDGYLPGATYRLRVVLEDSWAARDEDGTGDQCGAGVTPYRRCDENGFALELATRRGDPVGGLAPAGATCGAAPADPEVRVMASGAAVTHSGNHAGLTAWTLCWTAPAAGTGPLTAFLAAVDGGGGDGTPANPEDATGDDVVAGAVGLAEHGRGAHLERGGCAAGGEAGLGAALGVLVLGVARARRRRAAAIALVGLVGLGLAGCVHVKPHQKQDLAKRKMRFAPDATEDELDLHMQEAREGSAGGYGTAGGGCGCN